MKVLGFGALGFRGLGLRACYERLVILSRGYMTQDDFRL